MIQAVAGRQNPFGNHLQLREPGVAGRPGGSEQEVGRAKIAGAFSGLARPKVGT